MIVLLFFFFHVLHYFYYLKMGKTSFSIISIAILSLLSLNSLPGSIFDQTRLTYSFWVAQYIEPDPVKEAFVWISKNTLNGSVAILPPWRKDAWYYTQRAQVACYDHPVYDNRFSEWKKRNEELSGPSIPGRSRSDRIEFYNNLKEAEIVRISKEYMASFILSRGNYSFPVLYENDGYRVYRIKDQ
jgi:hypothetical protein